MPPQSKLVSLRFLGVYFIWVLFQNLPRLLFPSSAANYHYYTARGMPWVHFAFASVTVAMAAYALWYLWRGQPGWLKATLMALAVFAVVDIIDSWDALSHLDIAKDAYATSRETRGLSPAGDRLDAMFEPSGIKTAAALSLALYGLIAVIAWRRWTRANAQHSQV